MATNNYGDLIVCKGKEYYKNFQDLDEKDKFNYIMVFILTLLTLGFLDNLITYSVCLAYPIYKTVHVIVGKSANTELKNKWLIYWLVYSFTEFMSGILRVLPYYSVLRTTFLLLCFMPKPPTFPPKLLQYELSNKMKTFLKDNLQIIDEYVNKINRKN